MTTALAVANAFIRLANEKNISISNMKLQKLVYFAQGFHAALNNGRPLFEEGIEAWKYGPVIPDLYHKFKIYFAGAIPNNHPYQSTDVLTSNEEKLVEWVLQNLGNHSAISLSNFSHATGSPWDLAFNSTEPSEHSIPVDGMTNYFKGLLVPSTPSTVAA